MCYFYQIFQLMLLLYYLVISTIALKVSAFYSKSKKKVCSTSAMSVPSSVTQTNFSFAPATCRKTLRLMQTVGDISTTCRATTQVRYSSHNIINHLNRRRFKESLWPLHLPSNLPGSFRHRNVSGCSLCCNTTAGDFGSGSSSNRHL